MTNKFLEKHTDYFYLVFRIIVGLLFILHGIMKWGAISSFSVTNLMFYAGIIEIVGGAFIIIGLFTRTTALIAGVEMLFAYFMAHASNGLSPLVNKGEPALLFFAAFLVLLAFGARKYSIDNLKRK